MIQNGKQHENTEKWNKKQRRETEKLRREACGKIKESLRFIFLGICGKTKKNKHFSIANFYSLIYFYYLCSIATIKYVN